MNLKSLFHLKSNVLQYRDKTKMSTYVQTVYNGVKLFKQASTSLKPVPLGSRDSDNI